jgi:hypothetical protein
VLGFSCSVSWIHGRIRNEAYCSERERIMEYDLPDTAIHYADWTRGVYIPQFFAESVKRECVSGISVESLDLLLIDPNGEYESESDLDKQESYWDTWTYILDNARVTDPRNGNVYVLYQDGDLWLVPENWNPERESE